MSQRLRRRIIGAVALPVLALGGLLALAAPASAAPIGSATIGEPDCALPVGSFGLTIEGLEVTVGNTGDEPLDFTIQVQGQQDTGGQSLAPGGEATFAFQLQEDTPTRILVIENLPGSTQVLADETVAIDCDPNPDAVLTATISDADCMLDTGGLGGLTIEGFEATLTNDGDSAITYEILLNGEVNSSGPLALDQPTLTLAITLEEDVETVVEIFAIDLDGDRTLAEDRTVTLNCDADAGPAPTPVGSATIGTPDCALPVGSIGLTIEGVEVTVTNDGGAPLDFTVLVEGQQDTGGQPLAPGASATFAYELTEDTPTRIQVIANLDGSTQSLADETVEIDCDANPDAVLAATISDADCLLDVGSPFGLTIEGFATTLTNNGDSRISYEVLLNGAVDSSGPLTVDQELTLAITLDEDVPTLVEVVAINLDGDRTTAASNTVLLDCDANVGGGGSGDGGGAGGGAGGGNGGGTQNSGSMLPYTGVEVGPMLALGMTLLAGGVGATVLGRRRQLG